MEYCGPDSNEKAISLLTFINNQQIKISLFLWMANISPFLFLLVKRRHSVRQKISLFYTKGDNEHEDFDRYE